ncbi:hypothetical protein FRC11_011308, partial [Ceratobasidium sp. 423]
LDRMDHAERAGAKVGKLEGKASYSDAQVGEMEARIRDIELKAKGVEGCVKRFESQAKEIDSKATDLDSKTEDIDLKPRSVMRNLETSNPSSARSTSSGDADDRWPCERSSERRGKSARILLAEFEYDTHAKSHIQTFKHSNIPSLGVRQAEWNR